MLSLWHHEVAQCLTWCALQLIREQLILCYKKEGVNQARNCRDLKLRYLEEIKDIGVHRYASKVLCRVLNPHSWQEILKHAEAGE